MPCVSPIKIEHEGLASMVRCGRCRYCRIRKKQAWVGRLRLEALDHFAGRFVTLTYNQDPGILDYRDFQLFMKRYVYHYGPCRYFAVGEYGDKNGRGHWHALLFGHAQEFRGHWKDNPAWSHGWSYDGTITKESIGYVSGYVMKATSKDRPNITRMSLRPGIGMPRLEKMGATVAAKFQEHQMQSWPSFFKLDGKRYPLCDGGLVAFKRGFLEAGGFAPQEETPEERHVVALETLVDLGTRIESERKFNAHYMHLKGADNGALKASRERQ